MVRAGIDRPVRQRRRGDEGSGGMTNGHGSIERHGAQSRDVEMRIEHVLETVERALIYIVALFLVILAVLALVNTVLRVTDPILHHHDYTKAIANGIDAAFLTVILLELLHTVLSRGPLSRQLQEFLVIGITSAVRHSLEIAAAGGSDARGLVIDLAINAGGVLILVVALWLVRQQTGIAVDERMDLPPESLRETPHDVA